MNELMNEWVQKCCLNDLKKWCCMKRHLRMYIAYCSSMVKNAVLLKHFECFVLCVICIIYSTFIGTDSPSYALRRYLLYTADALMTPKLLPKTR